MSTRSKLIVATFALILFAFIADFQCLPWKNSFLIPFTAGVYLVFWLSIVYPRRSLSIDTEKEMDLLPVLSWVCSYYFNFFDLTPFQKALGLLYAGVLLFLFWGINVYLSTQKSVWDAPLTTTT